MRSNEVLGFIFAGTLDDKIPELAASRTTASVPIGGKYRLIDFVLSNMSNSGVNNVGIHSRYWSSVLNSDTIKANNVLFGSFNNSGYETSNIVLL